MKFSSVTVCEYRQYASQTPRKGYLINEGLIIIDAETGGSIATPYDFRVLMSEGRLQIPLNNEIENSSEGNEVNNRILTVTALSANRSNKMNCTLTDADHKLLRSFFQSLNDLLINYNLKIEI